MRQKGYGSRFVILSVCLSVYDIMVTVFSSTLQLRYKQAESVCQFLAIGLVDFTKMPLFLSYGWLTKCP